MKISNQDTLETANKAKDNDILSNAMKYKGCYGAVEIIVKDRNGNVVHKYKDPNIVKVFAKEMLSHRLPSTQVWDPTGGSGSGAWVDTSLDLTEEFSARYILLGAAFDQSGAPIENDPRYYTLDTSSGTYLPIRLEPGAYYDGGLINGCPIAEPYRPLKRVESISFETTYQPAGIPLLQEDVRAMNNIVKFQTTIQLDEYNGIGTTDSDYFLLTEVALAGGKKFDSVDACECTPTELFLDGPGTPTGGTTEDIPLQCTASGSDTISIALSESAVDMVKVGDQIKIVGKSDARSEESISQVSPFYFVMSKAVGGRDITLDRTPVDSNNAPITGDIGIYRSSLRIFSHRILAVPVQKTRDFEIVVIWTLIMN